MHKKKQRPFKLCMLLTQNIASGYSCKFKCFLSKNIKVAMVEILKCMDALLLYGIRPQ